MDEGSALAPTNFQTAPIARRLVEILKKLEQQKADLISEIERWSPERLNYRPASEEWSVLEMLDHIVRTEVAILSAAERGLVKPHRIGIEDKLRTTFLEKVFASDRKVKVPATASQVLPGSMLDLQEIRERWYQSREELESFISRSDPELLSKGIFKHPVGGWMGMEQILGFFSIHIFHHRFQLNKIVRSADLAKRG